MKKFLLSLPFFLIVMVNQAQVLNVNQCIQEQNQWCWAGVSQCVLDYYGNHIEQCDIAEYARTVIDWYNFGQDYCCDNPGGLCNYWNYMWGAPGSIQDILEHFAAIYNYGISNAIPKTTIQNEISNNRPFIIRWGWNSGGGHFVVGHGLVDQTVYYMDPWFGEGHKFASYDWMVNDGSHTWTHTTTMAASPETYTITATSDSNGAINPNGNIQLTHGANKTFTFIANSNYEVNQLLVDNINTIDSIAGGSYTFKNVLANHTIHVTFKIKFVPVTNIIWNTPTEATAGIPLILMGTVEPSNATNQNIEWSIADAGTTGATITGNTFNAIADGTAIVKATIADGLAVGMDYTQELNIKVDVVGIENIILSQIALYPNPTNGVLNLIQGQAPNSEFITGIEIFDVTGRVVYTVETRLIASLQDDTTTRLDISQLPVGVYFIRIQTENGMVMRKVVKQ